MESINFMILRRLGNKSKIAKEIQKHFPPHRIYIEPFFGAGGMFFYKPKAKYNIVNDIDSDVFNLYQVVSNQKNELEKTLYETPIHQDLIKYWTENKETEPLKKAVRFLFLSNFILNGCGGTLRSNAVENSKTEIIDKLKVTYDLIFDVRFFNIDFRKFIHQIHFRSINENLESFFYCDPPYLFSGDNYSHSFTEQDSIDLFNSLQETGCNFAMSEFDNEFIMQQAKERKLNIIYIGERQNLKNRRTEILITNYQVAKSLFDHCS